MHRTTTGGDNHPKCVNRVIFRSQFAGQDARKVLAGLNEPIDDDGPFVDLDGVQWPKVPKSQYTEVEVNGVIYCEFGRHKSKYSDVELPPLFRERKSREWIRLFDKDGNEKKEGDAPLGIAYDEDGVPVSTSRMCFVRYVPCV